MSVYALPAPPDGLTRLHWRADDAIRAELLGLVSFPAGHRGALHSHTFWELIFIGEGQGACVRDGARYACRKGDVLLVRPGEPHRFLAAASDPLEQMYFGFSFDCGDGSSSEAAPRLPAGGLAETVSAEFRACLDNLKRNGGPEALSAARGRLLAAAGRVVAWLAGGSRSLPEAGRGDVVRLARERLQADLRAKITVPGLARTFGLSPQHFGATFKRRTGASVKAYQRNLRLDRAMELLKEGEWAVAEVAAAVGLEDEAYFSRLFKSRFGFPPREARIVAG